MLNILQCSFDNKKARFLMAGFFNICIGYIVSIIGYGNLDIHLHTIFIGVIVNIVTITISFLIYKKFVFMTSGNWLIEWGKAFLVYGVIAIISIILMWFMIDFVGLNVWIAPLIAMLLSYIFSYFAHDRFTFKNEAIFKDAK